MVQTALRRARFKQKYVCLFFSPRESGRGEQRRPQHDGSLEARQQGNLQKDACRFVVSVMFAVFCLLHAVAWCAWASI